MATAPGSGEEDQDAGQLIFQKSKLLDDECYIINVHDSPESACVKFSAYELESSETFALSYSYVDFDGLFKEQADLANPANKEGRYSWVIERLDLMPDAGGAAKRLVLSSAPTEAEVQSRHLSPVKPPGAPPRERLTYAERMRLRQEAERLEEKRAANVALKSERNRKAFVAELQEQRKLEELKMASRRQRIDEERAERREKAEIQKRMQEERAKRYEENDRKREEHIAVLEAERKARDLAHIQEIVEAARTRQENKKKMLEDARNRKVAEEEVQAAEQAAKKEADQRIEAKREARIAERNQRLKQAEHEYLEYRKQQIEQIAGEKQQKEEKKKEYLRNKAAQRAAALRSKHEKIEAWERLEDHRAQNCMKKEHNRNMLMVDHIEHLRQRYSQELAEASKRKEEAFEHRRAREAKQAAISAEGTKRQQELEAKREEAINSRERKRQEKNQNYCQYIRDMRTSEALRVRDQRQQVELAQERSHEERMRERQARSEQDFAAAQVAAQREENIRARERERDLKFAKKVREGKDQDRQRAIEMEAKKTLRRLQEREAAEKHQEEEMQRRHQMALLDEHRDAMIRERVLERNQREQERIRGATATGERPDRGANSAGHPGEVAAVASEGGS